MKTLILVGLGNPGEKFERTRHNLGIRTVQAWYDAAKSHAISATDWKDNVQLESQVAELSIEEAKVVCVFPLTFMNNSSKAVAAVAKQYSTSPEDVVIVHDDLELPFGEVEATHGGSAKGHNGVRSVQEALGTQDFRRVRVGIGRPPEGVEPKEYVLGQFSEAQEQALSTSALPKAVETITELVAER